MSNIRMTVKKGVQIVFMISPQSKLVILAVFHYVDCFHVFFFQVYFLAVVWLKCRGAWSWLLTSTLVGVLFVILTVNLWAGDVLQWK